MPNQTICWRQKFIACCISTLSLFVAVGLLKSDAHAEGLLSAIPTLQAKAGSAVLDQWLVVGPFKGGDMAYLLKQDLVRAQLANAGASVSESEFENIKRYVERGPQDSQSLQGDSVDLKMFYHQPYEDSEPASAAYLLCKVKSDQAQSAYLLFGCDDAAQIWLNGKSIMEQSKERHVNQYSEAIKVDLLAGENVLCIKTVRRRRGWTITARMAGTSAEAASLALEGHAMLHGILLQGAVFPVGKPVVFSPRGVPADARIDCTIRNFEKTWEKRVELDGRRAPFPNSEDLPVGLYWAEILHGGVRYEQPFIKGGLKAVADTWVNRSGALKVGRDTSLNIEAIKRRLSSLLEDEKNRQDRPIIHAVAELAAIVVAIESSTDPYKAVSGMHVRAFRSKIDDQVEYYRVFAPTVVKNGSKLPLVVVLPTTVSSRKPFIESAFMKAHLEAERMCAIAEKFGVVLLWCGYRKPLRADPCEYAHIDEVIGEVSHDYNIDPQAISLTGSCSGGVLALGLLTREPEKFAAAAVHNAVFGVERNTAPAVVRTCYSNPFFQQWALKKTDISEYMAGSSAPILLVHDGEGKEGHGDLSISLKFEELARRNGKAVELEQVPQTLSEHMAAWERMIGWLSQVRKTDGLKPVARSKTVAEFFTRRFVVLTGDNGAPEEQQAVKQLADRFAEDWRKSMFGNCRRADEKSFGKAAMADENIVLIGNPVTSRLWRQLATKVGLVVEADKICLGGRVWDGKDLFIQVRTDNPQVAGGSIIFVGGNDMAKANLPTMNLAMDGWFQFAVWDAEGRLVDAGLL